MLICLKISTYPWHGHLKIRGNWRKGRGKNDRKLTWDLLLHLMESDRFLGRSVLHAMLGMSNDRGFLALTSHYSKETVTMLGPKRAAPHRPYS